MAFGGHCKKPGPSFYAFCSHLRGLSCEVSVLQAPLPAAEKETPMQRMKRLRAAQLNTTIQKDSLGAAQKKANEERDRQARAQIERSAREQQPRSPSPGYLLMS